MAVLSAPAPSRPLHPLHAILLAFPFPLFLGTLLADIAYLRSFQIQWANFAQWLNAGGLLVGAFAVLWALAGLFRRRRTGDRGPVLYALLLLAAWGVGFVNALIHTRDAWAIMPLAPWLSGLAALLALAASWIGYRGFHDERWA